MDPIVVVFVVVNAVALLCLPRRWAAAPLLVGACYMTRAQTIQLGIASLTVVRILVAVGLVRIIVRREWIIGTLNGLDALLVAWGLWMVCSVVFHSDPASPFVLRVRDLYEAWGLYLLFRVFCRTREDIDQMSRVVALVLVPIGIAMIAEKATGANLFSRFGGVDGVSAVRNGVIRAQGPFAHAILAGSIGGVCLPLAAGLWRRSRGAAILGIGACVAMIIASGSSGPILAGAAGLSALALWPARKYMRAARWTILALYALLELKMNRPAYFIISDLDLIGGSTSWYRAELIRSAIAHIGEWWLVGTDYTRHWMSTGVTSSPNQTDITNHFIAMGVVAGLPLMLLFIALFVKGFSQIGVAMTKEMSSPARFTCWYLGASLWAHAVTCLSVSYYDHSVIFLYMTLAATTATLSTEIATQPAAGVARGPVQAGVGRLAVNRRRIQQPVAGALRPQPR